MRYLLLCLLWLTACTPQGMVVVDTDNDGILDDECPNTFLGEVTNEKGCTARQLRIKAWRALPHEFDRLVRYVDRIPVRETKKYIRESLNGEFYQKNRAFLSEKGNNVFAADFVAMSYLTALACKGVPRIRKLEVSLRSGQGRFVLSSGFGVVITTGSQISSANLRDFGYIACNQKLQPFGEAALNAIFESERLVITTIKDPCDEERVRKNLLFAQKNFNKNKFHDTVANYQSAWKAATSCKWSGLKQG